MKVSWCTGFFSFKHHTGRVVSYVSCFPVGAKAVVVMETSQSTYSDMKPGKIQLVPIEALTEIP